ncbi:uncharacterized protein LOC125769031 isoform X1 [Anopheles funestus]|uniref:uncharacterized protein LOC128932667 n=1 Tax=Anopheles funestus TaxID=62324 RepID=UPI0020C675EF|nr:uncharacterized protein LOC128932667 [Anopheles funestus]
MQVSNMPEIPIMVLGIFCGSSKPDNVEGFLRPLVSEINHILVQGILINETVVDIRLGAFIADTPARAFINGVKSYNARHGCIKCKIVGTFDESARKTLFGGTAEDRADEEFRRGEYTEHQLRHTPLLDINEFDIVKDIIVADNLHILHLGLTRTLLKGYILGSLPPLLKWTPRELKEISKLLVNVEYPSEIHRKQRALNYITYWKGSELAAFLHHSSIPLLKNRISDRAYEHFKLFFLAANILSSKLFEQYWEYAGQLLQQFVSEFSTVYSRNYLTSNIHNLLHIPADVQRFGPLPLISSYPFENKLQYIKRLVKTGHRELNQVVCRLTELSELETAVENTKEQVQYPLLKIKKEEVILQVKPNFILRKGNRNSWFLTQGNEIVKYSKAIQSSGKFFIEGHLVTVKYPTFTTPVSSEIIYNYTAKSSNISETLLTIDLESVKCKLVATSLDKGNSFNFSPLLHTFDE